MLSQPALPLNRAKDWMNALADYSSDTFSTIDKPSRFKDGLLSLSDDDECDMEIRNVDNPTKLFASLQRKDWGEVLNRVYFEPHEAGVWIYRKSSNESPINAKDEKKYTWKLLPLHAAIVLGAPAYVILEILNACPSAAKRKDQRGSLPIHLAVSRIDLDPDIDRVVNHLLRVCPASASMVDGSGQTPIEIACESQLRREALNIELRKNKEIFERDPEEEGFELELQSVGSNESFIKKDLLERNNSSLTMEECFTIELFGSNEEARSTITNTYSYDPSVESSKSSYRLNLTGAKNVKHKAPGSPKSSECSSSQSRSTGRPPTIPKKPTGSLKSEGEKSSSSKKSGKSLDDGATKSRKPPMFPFSSKIDLAKTRTRSLELPPKESPSNNLNESLSFDTSHRDSHNSVIAALLAATGDIIRPKGSDGKSKPIPLLSKKLSRSRSRESIPKEKIDDSGSQDNQSETKKQSSSALSAGVDLMKRARSLEFPSKGSIPFLKGRSRSMDKKPSNEEDTPSLNLDQPETDVSTISGSILPSISGPHSGSKTEDDGVSEPVEETRSPEHDGWIVPGEISMSVEEEESKQEHKTDSSSSSLSETKDTHLKIDTSAASRDDEDSIIGDALIASPQACNPPKAPEEVSPGIKSIPIANHLEMKAAQKAEIVFQQSQSPSNYSYESSCTDRMLVELLEIAMINIGRHVQALPPFLRELERKAINSIDQLMAADYEELDHLFSDPELNDEVQRLLTETDFESLDTIYEASCEDSWSVNPNTFV